MSNHRNVQAFEVMDSRGNPTVMAEVTLESGEVGTPVPPPAPPPAPGRPWSCAMVIATRYLGKGVLNAVGHVNGPIAICCWAVTLPPSATSTPP